MIDNFETLKLKIDYLQNLVDTKQNDIFNLKEAFSSNVRYYNNLVEKQKRILDSLKNNTINFYGKHLEREFFSSSLHFIDVLFKTLI